MLLCFLLLEAELDFMHLVFNCSVKCPFFLDWLWLLLRSSNCEELVCSFWLLYFQLLIPIVELSKQLMMFPFQEIAQNMC